MIHLHCQPLNEIWEGVDPGSIPSRHSGTLHAPELPGLALPSARSSITASGCDLVFPLHFSTTLFFHRAHTLLSPQRLQEKPR